MTAHSNEILRFVWLIYSRQASASSASGYLRLIGIREERVSSLTECKEIARFTCRFSAVKRLIPGIMPTVDTVKRLAPSLYPSSSLRMSIAFKVLA